MSLNAHKVMNLINIFQIFIICLPGISCQTPQGKQQTANVPQMTIAEPQPGATDIPQYLHLLRNKSVACVVNHSSRIGGVHLVDSLYRLGIQIKVVFAPEHGFRGGADAGEHIADEKDRATGIPIISLYGDKKKPSENDLAGIDVILFDIQDVGVRFYTYISTLHLLMESCAESKIPLILLDRPNPNGYYADGPVLQPGYQSFVGMHPIPVVYGMTIGELAQMINGENWLANQAHCDLHVIPCTQYDHTMTYHLPIAPSPNLPNLRSVLLYPSICFFEGTHVSVGRGTDRQFQILGHPGYTPESFSFTPQSKPGATKPPHHGVQLFGTDLTSLTIDEIRAWKKLNMKWLIEYHRQLDPTDHFFLEKTDFFDKLAGSDALRNQLEAGWTQEQIRDSWANDIAHFLELRKKYLLYPDF